MRVPFLPSPTSALARSPLSLSPPAQPHLSSPSPSRAQVSHAITIISHPLADDHNGVRCRSLWECTHATPILSSSLNLIAAVLRHPCPCSQTLLPCPRRPVGRNSSPRPPIKGTLGPRFQLASLIFRPPPSLCSIRASAVVILISGETPATPRIIESQID